MSSISITDLKINPSKAIAMAGDSPLAVLSRNKTKAYLVGSDLFEQMVAYIEDLEDAKAVEETNFSQSKDFELLASELGI